LEQLLAEGRIDGNEASALLREVAPPPAERAEGAVAAKLADEKSDRSERRVIIFCIFSGPPLLLMTR